MKCSSCGWPNRAGVKICVKCGYPVEGEGEHEETMFSNDADVPSAQRGTQVMNLDNDPQGHPAAYDTGFGPGHESRFDKGAASPAHCLKCGYPLRSGAEKCPNCNYAVKAQPAPAPAVPPAPAPAREEDRSVPPPLPPHVEGGTVNPYMMDVPQLSDGGFSLRPLPRMGEVHALPEMEFEGEHTVLNRNNTEPGNPSITSREQAVVSCDAGQWYIEDRSDMKTTFVQAGRKTPLRDGDIILLGNRLFEFHTRQ